MKRVSALLAMVAMLLAGSARGQSVGQATINVMDYASNPVPHAWVVIRQIGIGGGHVHQYANVNGSMTHMLPQGSYTAHAHHFGIGSGMTSFSVLPGEAVNVNVWLNYIHYYGYYHWYRIHRVGVHHLARVEHLAREHEIATAQNAVHGRRLHERPTAGAGAGTGTIGAQTSAGGAGNSQQTGRTVAPNGRGIAGGNASPVQGPPSPMHGTVGNGPTVQPHLPAPHPGIGPGPQQRPAVGSGGDVIVK